MVSVDEARGLLNEHMSLMTSVAALRGSLHFESELFEIFPAPVLLDTNALLRVTYKFQETQDTAFLQSSSFMMMQMWVSIDGLIYRPLSSPAIIQPTLDQSQQHENEEVVHGEEEGTTYSILKLHELSGMSMTIDDNTLRYRLQGDELCVNALVSNTYLLYLFNPLQYRPLDWTFNAMLQIGETRYVLPVQREGVFLNTTSYALRIFISYGKLPKKPPPLSSSKMMTDEAKAVENPLTGGACGAEDSGPLDIPYNGQREIFAFRLTATNRISKKTCVVASKAACLSLVPSANSAATGEGVDRQQSIVSSSTLSNEEENTDESDTSAPSDCTVPHFERHVHLPFDAMICYYFAPNCSLQYVEFAIGFEPLMHLLGVAVFLPEGMTAC
ncbi:unnamed protein product [Peronospora belbahrii]|uniref:Uncharacterized protein n=1 Tax=Peronospora belbahrii TaxID=622444 RepID=A0AAU9LAB9_9STRA|nr:unnamed protein product [Peronospora belbahrii]CAH0521907.1 unnamed protein product [Peronospora belbahrii]